jgi:hypothetical protein
MKKGISGLQNINALRWLRKYEIEPIWNILYGFPGEKTDDYSAQEALIPRLYHLSPPLSVGPVRLDRFSPNYEFAELRSEFLDVQPLQSYRFIYPPELDLSRAAAFFSGRARSGVTEPDVAGLKINVHRWKQKWGRLDEYARPAGKPEDLPFLRFEEQPDGAIILDGRDVPRRPIRHILDLEATNVYKQLFERPVSVQSLYSSSSGQQVTAILDRFDSDRLIAQCGQLAIALAID